MGHEAEADQASGCASNAQTASRSSCADVATSRIPRCQRTTGRRPGRAHVCCAGILRDGSFGQHCGLSGHASQSSLLARYKSVLPPCTVPLVPSRFPAGAVVDVAGRIISKVAAREGTVISLRLVEHGDMWCDALRLDQPVQHRSSPVSGIPGKPLRLDTKALLCSFDHCPRRSDLGLANSHPSGSPRALRAHFRKSGRWSSELMSLRRFSK